MNTVEDIRAFVAQKTLAIVGMSRAPRSFSASAARELRSKGYRLYVVNPKATEIEGETCYPALASLPEKVGGALFLTPPSATGQAVRDAVAAGVRCLWIQQGAESEEALTYCRANTLTVVSGQCILMFAEPVVSFHRAHRFLRRIFGRLPGRRIG